MKHLSYFLLLFSASLLIFSCDRRECSNTNPVFDQYIAGEKAYNVELLHQINMIDNRNLRYWFKEYRVRDGQEELCFYVQGEGLCAEMVMKVNDWSQLKVLREAKGETYQGAEFTGLKYSVISDSSKTEFFFKSYTSIID